MESNQDNRKKQLLIFTLTTTVIILILLGIFFLLPDINAGRPLRENGNLTELREDFKLILQSYTDTMTIVTTAFGAIAFLVTYQQKQGTIISIKAWSLLSSGIIALVGALVFCFFGKELLLKMLEDNVINFSMGALKYGRWTSYVCIILAGVFVGFFAIEVATTSHDLNQMSTNLVNHNES